MSHRGVFLSSSPADQAYLDAFKKHLKPFVDEGRFRVDDNYGMTAGTDRELAVRNAIRDAVAAVVLVSADLLADEDLMEEQIPRLVEAREAGRLDLTYLFVRSAMTDVKVDVLDGTTGQPGVVLTKYKGLNSPTEPIALLSESRQDAELAECARKLAQMVDRRPARRERRTPRERQELTVELRPRDGQVDRRYAKPHYDDLFQSSGPVNLSRLELLVTHRSDENDRELAARLCEVLLGNDEQCTTVVRLALGEQRRNPIGYAARLRILTEDPRLRNLPWALARWRDFDLADPGWTGM